MKHAGTNGRGPIVLTGEAHPLVRRMVDVMNAERTSFTEIAKRAGIDRSTIRTWDKHLPRLDHFEAVLDALGLELFIRPRRISAEGSVS
jgi:DNA-binding phage protein